MAKDGYTLEANMFQIVPVNMISTPNYYTFGKDSFWTITGNTAITLWAQLQIVDDLGARPYVPAVGSTIQVVFPRGDAIGINTNPVLGVVPTVPTITVTKNAAKDASNGSLMSVTMSATDSTNVVSGTVQLVMTESGNTYRWNQNFFVKKLNIGNGF